jgi:WD40 repeat protein
VPEEQSAAAQKTRVFISYTRADMAFADKLVAALEARGFEVLIDRRNLPALEDWERELLMLIRRADTVVFIISPRSIERPVCRWEVEQMAALDKRLAPIVLERVADDKIPAAITKINYLFFDPPNDFDTQADALARALQTDIAWWHEHTRLVDLSGRWDREGRPEGQLLRSGAITAAQSWASRRPDKAQIPEMVFQFLDASLKKEEHDREELNKREQRISTERQRLVAELARRANEAGHHASAMRLALAGEPSEDERARGIMPEPSRRAQLAAAAHAALGVACFSGHIGSIHSVAISRDGTRVATALRDEKLKKRVEVARLWNVTSGTEVTSLAHDDIVWSVAFSADGSRVVTASSDTTARVWDAASGAELLRLAHPDEVFNAAFGADGTRVLTTEREGVARVWDAANGTMLVWLYHPKSMSSAAFSADGTHVATSAWGEARVWDAVSGAEIAKLQYDDNADADDDNVESAVFSPDGTRVATASWDKTARLWDTASGAEVVRLAHDGRVFTAEFSADGARVLTVSSRSARLWDAASGAEVRQLEHSEAVSMAAFSPDGARVLTISGDLERNGRKGQMWDVATGAPLPWLPHDSVMDHAAFSVDGSRVLAASGGTARVWEAASYAELARLAHDKYVTLVTFSPDSARVATADQDGVVRVWDIASCAELARLRTEKKVSDVVFSADCARVVTADNTYNMRVWDIQWN